MSIWIDPETKKLCSPTPATRSRSAAASPVKRVAEFCPSVSSCRICSKAPAAAVTITAREQDARFGSFYVRKKFAISMNYKLIDFTEESSSTRKRDRESDSETSVIVPSLKRSNRRSIRSSLLSFIFKDRNPRAISASESTDDADLLTNSERLQRMSNLFTELGKLFGAHARATEKKKENDKENDE